MEGCIVVGETVCGLFNTIVVMSVAGVQGKFESKPILQIFESGSQTCSHTQDTYICSFLNLFCLQGRGCQEVQENALSSLSGEIYYKISTT